jgi:hypothetical protein
MSAKVKHVAKAQKDQGKCSKCQTPLPAGSEYRYFKPGFRSRVKVRRCMKPECTPKRSELDTSRMSEALGAQEDGEAAIHDATEITDLKQAVEDTAAQAREVIDAYEDAISETPMLEDQLREKIDLLDQWADALEGYDPEEIDDEETDEEVRLQQFEDAKQEAYDVVGSLEY